MTKDDLDDEEYSQSSTAATSASESKPDDACATSDEKPSEDASIENKPSEEGDAANAEGKTSYTSGFWSGAGISHQPPIPPRPSPFI